MFQFCTLCWRMFRVLTSVIDSYLAWTVACILWPSLIFLNTSSETVFSSSWVIFTIFLTKIAIISVSVFFSVYVNFYFPFLLPSTIFSYIIFSYTLRSRVLATISLCCFSRSSLVFRCSEYFSIFILHYVPTWFQPYTVITFPFRSLNLLRLPPLFHSFYMTQPL